jgi:malonate-semialdehyde dehydrogenase (acetylating) / methylmalonate-semialdehyde dehydrogenase
VPPGILNIVHGGKDVGQAITDHPDIKAVSFIGSTAVGKFVYARGAGNGKRMQCMGGAKNHGVILPDADLDQVVADVLAGAFGSAGERCMFSQVNAIQENWPRWRIVASRKAKPRSKRR